MAPKPLDIKIRILLFIICSVGILYISMRLFYKQTEGFQQVTDNCLLDTTTFPGKRVWECPTNSDAVSLFYDNNAKINLTDQVCFPTPNPTVDTSNYFTCYQRPAGKSFNFVTGVSVDSNSVLDQTPFGIENDMSQVCSDYNGETARFVNILNSTIAYQQIVSTASGRVSFTTNQLISLSSTYCVAPISEQKFIDFCNTLSTGIGIYITLPQGNYGLNYISTTITAGIYASTNNLYTNVYLPGYNGFQCSTFGLTVMNSATNLS
jgi:hypothetical protein